MGSLRYFRRVQIAPGIRLNLTGRGASFSMGVRGAHVTVGRNGVRRSVGIPGTGLFYTSSTGHHTGIHSGRPFTPAGATAGPGAAGCLILLLAGGGALAALICLR